MKTELEQLQKEFNERIEKLKKKYEEPISLEKGKWYKQWLEATPGEYKYEFILGCFSGNFSKGDAFGFSANEAWCNDLNFERDRRTELAAKSEIKEMLIKEAKKRGFKEGVKTDYKEKEESICRNTFTYYILEDTLFANEQSSGGPRIYSNGQWATIVKDEPIMIGGKEVVIHPRAQEISIDGVCYTKSHLTDIANIFKVFGTQIKSLNVGCNGQYKVDLELINKILDRLK